MLQKRQIRAFKFNVFVSLLLGIATIFPFRTLKFDGGYELDILLKCFIFPLVIIMLSVKANVYKYRELEDCRLRSKVVNLTSYLPSIIYLLALLTSTLQTLTIGMFQDIATSLFDSTIYGIVFVIIFALVLCLIFSTKFLNKLILKADKAKLISIDVLLGMFMLMSILVFYAINNAYYNAFNELAIYHKGNVVLLIIFVIGFISFFRLNAKVKKVFNENESHISMNVSEVVNYEPTLETKNAEYRRAFKKIKQEFGAFLIKENQKNTELPQEAESDVQENQSETLVKE